MVAFLKNLVRDEQGQDLAEYGIALAVIGVGAALAAIAIAGNVSTLWSKADSIISQAV
jgi:Flp pilus assembly pilin Flp